MYSMHYGFLEEICRGAGAVLRSRFGSDLDIRTKSDASIVTEADLASEKYVLDRIRKAFPTDVILSEEAGLTSTDRTPGRGIWILDPLDGTSNFANRYPFYCVTVARCVFRDDGTIQPICGAVFDPERDHYYAAGQGQGATLNGRPVKVAPERDFAGAFLVTGFYYHRKGQLDHEIRRFARVAQKCQTIRRDGSAALDLALVAAGIFDGFWETGLKPWDIAAGSLLVQEAGGLVLNYPEVGKASAATSFFSMENPGIIAGNAATAGTLASLMQTD